MEIFGREVTAIKYGDYPLVNAYVARKKGDCQREADEGYCCLRDCEDKFVIARFMEKQPISIKSILPYQISISPGFKGNIPLRNLDDFKSAAAKPDYMLLRDHAFMTLVYRGSPIAHYIPCGVTNKPELFGIDAQKTTQELISRVDEVYDIAKQEPLEAILKDVAISKYLSDPRVIVAMSMAFGSKGINLVKELESMKAAQTSKV